MVSFSIPNMVYLLSMQNEVKMNKILMVKTALNSNNIPELVLYKNPIQTILCLLTNIVNGKASVFLNASVNTQICEYLTLFKSSCIFLPPSVQKVSTYKKKIATQCISDVFWLLLTRNLLLMSPTLSLLYFSISLRIFLIVLLTIIM